MWKIAKKHNPIVNIYDEMCDPVYVNGQPVHVLAWADDTAVFSLTEAGLKRSIDLTMAFYSDLGLSVNVKNQNNGFQ